MGQGIPEGRLRSVLLPLRGRHLQHSSREPRGYERVEDEPERADPVHPRLRHAGGDCDQARHEG
jgi:hypothetical protein